MNPVQVQGADKAAEGFCARHGRALSMRVAENHANLAWRPRFGRSTCQELDRQLGHPFGQGHDRRVTGRGPQTSIRAFAEFILPGAALKTCQLNVAMEPKMVLVVPLSHFWLEVECLCVYGNDNVLPGRKVALSASDNNDNDDDYADDNDNGNNNDNNSDNDNDNNNTMTATECVK
jgi:hypothetical protein